MALQNLYDRHSVIYLCTYLWSNFIPCPLYPPKKAKDFPLKRSLTVHQNDKDSGEYRIWYTFGFDKNLPTSRRRSNAMLSSKAPDLIARIMQIKSSALPSASIFLMTWSMHSWSSAFVVGWFCVNYYFVYYVSLFPSLWNETFRL